MKYDPAGQVGSVTDAKRARDFAGVSRAIPGPGGVSGNWESPSRAEHDSWVITLSDLMTLMLIFFLIWTTLKLTELKTQVPVTTQQETAELRPIRELESIFLEMAPVKRSRGRLVIVLQEDLNFPSGGAELTTRGRATIARIASILKHEAGYELDILGHTDTAPVAAGSRWKSNLELSLARAASVFAALAHDGINPARMKVQGLGALFPVAEDSGRMLPGSSRRVELVLKPARSLPAGNMT